MEEKVLNILAEICNDDIVRTERDIDIFDTGLIDSIAFIELLVAIEDDFGIEISPTEIERSEINTANKIIALIKARS